MQLECSRQAGWGRGSVEQSTISKQRARKFLQGMSDRSRPYFSAFPSLAHKMERESIIPSSSSANDPPHPGDDGEKEAHLQVHFYQIDPDDFFKATAKHKQCKWW